MQNSVCEVNGSKVIRIHSSLDTYNIADFKKTVFELITEGHRSVILDMQDVSFADSSAISAIIACQRRANLHKTNFALVNVSDNFIDILRLATLDTFFTIYSDYASIPEPVN